MIEKRPLAIGTVLACCVRAVSVLLLPAGCCWPAAVMALLTARLLVASVIAALLSGAALAAAPLGPPYVHTGPLACQANDKYPMLPTFHIIGNVTQATDGAIQLEPINDCSGVTFYKGIYHVWHQCCQNHWDHVRSTHPPG